MLVMIALKMIVMNNDDEIVNAIEIMRMITYKIAIMIVLIIIMTTNHFVSFVILQNRNDAFLHKQIQYLPHMSYTYTK